MISFVGLTYAAAGDATVAESMCSVIKAMEQLGLSRTWGIILGVVCFEACAFPTTISHTFLDSLKGYLYCCRLRYSRHRGLLWFLSQP